jgi:Integrase zinc binding domain
LERMQRTYYFPNIRKYVKDRIRKCDLCNRNKAVRHKLYGLLKSPEALKDAWEYIALDFIVKLPPSVKPIIGVVFDSILVVTDRLTKYGYFIPYKESSLVEELAYTFNKHIIENHGILKEIINDRDKLFTSRF